MQVDISSQDTFSDEVIVHLNVFGLSVKDWVPSQIVEYECIMVIFTLSLEQSRFRLFL